MSNCLCIVLLLLCCGGCGGNRRGDCDDCNSNCESNFNSFESSERCGENNMCGNSGNGCNCIWIILLLLCCGNGCGSRSNFGGCGCNH